MKRVIRVIIDWRSQYGQPPKTAGQLETDRRRVQEILERIGHGEVFDPNMESYRFEFEVGSDALNILMGELQSDPHLAGSHTRVTRYYTREELEAAELLQWGLTNQSIEEDYYELHDTDESQANPLYRRCADCGAPLEQIRDLIVNKRLMGKRDISLTYTFEIILTERVANLMQEHGLGCFDLRPVHHYKKSYRNEPVLYQLVVKNVLPSMASPPTEFEHIQVCQACQRRGQYINRTHWWGEIMYYEDSNVYYPRSVLDAAKDFNLTAEWLDVGRAMAPMMIINQRAYRFLVEHKIKNWEAIPVDLVDS